MAELSVFLELLFPPELMALGGRIHLRQIPEDRQQRPRSLNFDALDEAIRHKQAEGVHAYLSPTLRVRGKDSGKKSGVLASMVLWADIDAKEDGALSLVEAIERATTSGYPPSMVVQSGSSPERGHLYWLLEEPINLRSQREPFEAMLKRIADHLSGDRACAEAARVMRMPGTINYKAAYGPDFPTATLLQVHPEHRFTLELLDDVVPGAEQEGEVKVGKAVAEPSPLLNCAFVQHAVQNTTTLSEPLWSRLLWTLAEMGDLGVSLAHEWSESHPGYKPHEVDRRIEYARKQGYKAPSCKGVVEAGFSCPHYDDRSQRCRQHRARKPIDLINPLPPPGDAFLRGRQTYIVTREGVREIAAFTVIVEREVRAESGNHVEGRIVCVNGFQVSFDWPAEALGDNRSLSRNLAALLASRFICITRHLGAARDAWLRAAEPEQVSLSTEFGFSRKGDAFVDPDHPLPAGSSRLSLPSSLAASRLQLQELDERRLQRVTGLLCRTWPAVTGSPELVGYLLGLVGWSLIAPVLEARDPGVRPLIGWLLGGSGIGKTTHCRLAQCFFGDFSRENALVSFASTALGIEEEAHWFRGALMVVNDVKRSTMRPGDEASLLAFVQRAADRESRRRLNTAGQAAGGKPSRTTLLFNGEDQVISDTSALARVLAFPVPAPPDHPDGVRQLERASRHFSMVTRSLVERLLASPGWADEALERYHQLAREISGELGPVLNRHRMAKSVAAVSVGFELFYRWFIDADQVFPLHQQELSFFLVEQLRDQAVEVDDATPGQLFLENLRSALASEIARFTDGEGRGLPIGKHDPDKGLVCINYKAALPLLRHQMQVSLPPEKSILNDLWERGMIGKHNAGRRTYRVRLTGGSLVQTWALKEELIINDTEELEEAC